MERENVLPCIMFTKQKRKFRTSYAGTIKYTEYILLVGTLSKERKYALECARTKCKKLLHMLHTINSMLGHEKKVLPCIIIYKTEK